jgi:dipeptidyl aminopeptidase/acylaminoacyl peptidase
MIARKPLQWVALALCAMCVANAEGVGRGFTVTDSIEMSTFSSPSSGERSPKVDYSPDGRYFLVVTTRGVLNTNQSESTLRVFESQRTIQFVRLEGVVAAALQPESTLTFASPPEMRTSTPNAPLITDCRWSRDSSTLYFIEHTAGGDRQLFRFDVRSGRSMRLSLTNQDVSQFDVQESGIVYSTVTGPEKQVLGVPINPVVSSVTGMRLEHILFPNKNPESQPRQSELWIVRRGKPKKVTAAPSDPFMAEIESPWTHLLSLSPNGRFVVRALPVRDISDSWSRFEPLKGFEWRRLRSRDSGVTSPLNVNRPRQYVLVDLATGRSRAIIEAPQAAALAYSDVAMAVWSQDSKRLIVTNTFMPIGEQDVASQGHACAAASVDLSSGEAQCIVLSRDAYRETPENPDPCELRTLSFGSNSDRVAIRFRHNDGRVQDEQYRYDGAQWHLEATSPENGDDREKPLAITINQGLNDPPTLWAMDYASGHRKQILDPNPQLRNISFGFASLYHWTDRSGHAWTGVLVKPVDYVQGRRYPLVLQTHGFDDFTFLTDGKFPTAMAARPLATAGIMVLQMGSSYEHVGKLEEAHDQQLGFEAAVSHLDIDGLVDPHRVGITGFSRTAWHVETTLVDAPHLFAAATIADGIDEGYVQYMLFADGNRSLAREYETINGGRPFAGGLNQWVENGATFHLDRIRCPILMQAIDIDGLFSEWEIYSSLRQQGKPVDLLYIPEGQHILQKPLDRLASQQAVVDWYRFWLKGERDLTSTKASQYSTWEEFRKTK